MDTARLAQTIVLVPDTHPEDVKRPSDTASIRSILLPEIGLGLFILFAWIVLFAAGLMIGTEPYRVQLGAMHRLTFRQLVLTWSIVLTCYTLTNVALICCLSALLGALGRRTRIGGDEKLNSREDIPTLYLSAGIRGFFVYLTLLSGMVVLTGTSFLNASQETYIRLAGTASLFAFLSGHNPRLFSRLRTRLDDFAEGGHPGSSAVSVTREHAERETVTARKS